MSKAPSAAKEEFWRERVRAWKASGETLDEFVAKHGLARSTLRYWSGRFSRERRAVAEVPHFVEVVRKETKPVPPAAPEAQTRSRDADLVIEIGDARVRVSSGFDRGLLAEVVRALSGSAR